MARTTSTRSNTVDPTRPFYAAVGGVDLAVAAARSGLSSAQSRFAKVDLEPKSIVTEVQTQARNLPNRARALVSDAVSEAVSELNGTVDDLNKQYVDLAARGRTLVNRIRSQEATEQLQTEARKTTAKARTTRTQTAKAAGTAKKSAKATGTSARKTAAAAKRTASGAAAKTGA